MRQSGSSAQAGFILPTVVFVTVATTLLVLTVVARSADRAQTAANARAAQVFETAAAPIIDRARSKIEALINDDNLPRATPSEQVLKNVFDGPSYTYRDETRLQLIFDFGRPTRIGVSDFTLGTPDGRIVATSDLDVFDQEFVNSAWKFPIDTDNNGLFDSYGIYSILFRSRPPLLSDGNSTPPNPPDRGVLPIESRTLPFDETSLSGLCAGAAGVNVATNEGWTFSGNKLKKAFYVYSAVVPITDTASFPTTPTVAIPNPASRFEVFRGRRTISAIELQQDRARNPVNNNAAWFEGDLEIVRPARFRFNGRMYTGANLLIGAADNTNTIRLYQVSSSGTDKNNENKFGSCYYNRENAEINVAGNVVFGDAQTPQSVASSLSPVTVDLNRGQGIQPGAPIAAPFTQPSDPQLTPGNQTITQAGNVAVFNEFEFNRRVTKLVNDQIALSSVNSLTRAGGTINITYDPPANADPPAVQSDLKGRIRDEGIFGLGPTLETARRKALETYFRARLAKVFYAEVPYGTTGPDLTFTPVPIPASAGGGNDLAPPYEWAIPAYSNGGALATAIGNYLDYDGKGLRGGGKLTLRPPTTIAQLPTVGSETLQQNSNAEFYIGDRVRVGNNLPVRWLKFDSVTGSRGFVGESEPNQYTTNDSVFFNATNNINNPANTPPPKPRFRNTRAFSLDNLGDTDRGGFWELSAADDPSDGNSPPNETPITGGLRVITNAGIFSARPEDTFLPRFYTGYSDDDPVVTNVPTRNIDESAAPLWNGLPKDNPITVDGDNLSQPLDEATFAAPDPDPGDGFNQLNYVVWPDSMPMSGSIVFLNETDRSFPDPNNSGSPINIQVPASEAGYYPLAPNGLPTIDGTSSGTRVDLATPAQRNTARQLANKRGNLQMRASAVYHYKASVFNPETGTPQRPIACVSSYYDNSTPETARNGQVENGVATFVNSPWNFDPRGRSNNGLVYSAQNIPLAISGIPDFQDGKFVFSPAQAFNAFNAANPRNAAVPIGARLAYQANLVYPNGRFVNEPLRNVLRLLKANPSANLSIAERSTLDANICALQILDGTSRLITATDDIANINVLGATVRLPQGTFKESAFLDAREVKSLNRNESVTESGFGTTGGLIPRQANRADIYDLEIEQREPLEVRVTDLDLDRMRGATVTGPINSGVATEFLLPYSGLVYASREDGLKDLSFYDRDAAGNPIATKKSTRDALSSSDFVLDPTRKVVGVRLINGLSLWRDPAGLNPGNLDNPTNNVLGNLRVTASSTQPDFTPATRGEKGLILVSDLPAYIRAQRISGVTQVGFNVHTQQEFTYLLNEDPANPAAIWDNFYKRHRNNGPTDKLNPDFACRPKQTSTCNNGDQWRPATLLADAITIQSAPVVTDPTVNNHGGWRDGYRNDGDFDLRNNANTSTSINWQSTLNNRQDKFKDSFYVVERRKQGFFNNNFLTSADYLAQTNSDGLPGSESNEFPMGNRNSYNANGVTPVQRRVADGIERSMEVCRKVPLESCTIDDWKSVGGGTTTLPAFPATPPASPRPSFIYDQDRRFARRLAFLRYDDIYGDGNKALVFASACNTSGVTGGSTWPISINVNNNNLTVPQFLGSLSTPFTGTNKRLYGDVACPPDPVVININNFSAFEGRNRDNLSNLPITPPLPTTATWNTLTTGAGNNNNNFPYSRFTFDVSVTNLNQALGTVTADIAVSNTGTATRGSNPGNIGTTTANDNAQIDVITRIYAENGGGRQCYDASGTAISTGTEITKVFFRPNSPSATCRVAVLVIRDVMEEGDETFNVVLSNPVFAAPGNMTGSGTIRQQSSSNWDRTIDLPDIVVPGCGVINTVLSPYTVTGTESRDDGLITIRERTRQRTVGDGST
ncbi:MAG: hypothetical protein CV045_11405, partial [Cyanobacteria bacterium M5B4]